MDQQVETTSQSGVSISGLSISEYSDRIQQMTDCVSKLYSKYINDPYMKEATYNYICNRLPSILDNIDKIINIVVENQHKLKEIYFSGG